MLPDYYGGLYHPFHQLLAMSCMTTSCIPDTHCRSLQVGWLERNYNGRFPDRTNNPPAVGDIGGEDIPWRRLPESLCDV